MADMPREAPRSWRARARRIGIAAAGMLAVVLVLWATLEVFSWAVLRTGIVKPDVSAQLLVDAFPAVFRLERPVRAQAARGVAIASRSGLAFDTFDFDPAMGYRHIQYLRWFTPSRASRSAELTDLDAWWDRFAAEARGRFVVLCLGGSTTASGQNGNWPRYIADLLVMRGVTAPPIVLNAGHNGFMTMQEQIWASYWILPELDRRGVRVNLALTLDGVNDVSTVLGGWQAQRRYGNAPWLKSYNGFHQYLDAYSRSRERPGPAFTAFLAAAQRTPFVDGLKRGLAAMLPTTMAFARRLDGEQPFQPVGAFLLTWRGHNIFRVNDFIVAVPWTAGPAVYSEMPSMPTAKVARSLKEVLTLVATAGERGARASNVSLDASPAPDRRNWESLPDISMTVGDQQLLVDAFRSNLITLHSVFVGRGIPAISALQPIADPDDNPMVNRTHGKEIPTFDYVLAHWASVGTQPGTFMRMPGRATYRLAKTMYARLATEFPGRFVDLSRLYADGAEDYFVGDNIHYTPRGSVRLAQALLDACLLVRLCGSVDPHRVNNAGEASLADMSRLENDTAPLLLKSIAAYNIIRFAGRYWAVPQSAGGVDWERQDVSRVPGVLSGFTLGDVEAQLSALAAAASGLHK